jgi:hypothetical protein
MNPLSCFFAVGLFLAAGFVFFVEPPNIVLVMAGDRGWVHSA